MDRLPPDKRAAELGRAASQVDRVVGDASVADEHVGPPPRYSNDPYARQLRRCRKCGCEQVRCYHVTVHRTNGLPSGTTYDHVCPGCQRTFRTESIWSSVLSGPTGLAMALICAPVAVFTDLEWWSLGMCAGMALLGAFLAYSTVRRIYERVANRVVG